MNIKKSKVCQYCGIEFSITYRCSEKTWNRIKCCSRKCAGMLKRGYHLSIKSKEKISDAHKGKPSHRKGKHLSENHKNKIGKANLDINKGKHFSPETEFKCGENHPNWKGGYKLRIIRQTNKRRGLGHLFINKSFEGSEGHHLDNDYILYIPKELHRSIPHNLTSGKNMELINLKAMEWIMNTFKKYTER